MVDRDPHDAVRAVLTITVRPEHTTEFEHAWSGVADWVRSVPGCLRQSLVRRPTATPTYVITSDWVDADAFGRFEKSAEQDTMTAPLRRLRESIDMELCSLIEHRDPT